MKALAVDIGGTHATCGLVEDDRILAHESVDLTSIASIREVLSRVGDVFQDLIQRQSLSSKDFQGIAVGFPDLVDSRIGRVVSTNKI